MSIGQNHTSDQSLASLASFAPFARVLLDRLREHQERPNFTFEAEGKRFTLPRVQAEEILASIASLENSSPVFKQSVSLEEASRILLVDIEFVQKLLDRGDLPYYQENNKKTIPLEILNQYNKKRREAQREALSQIAQDAQEMGLYD